MNTFRCPNPDCGKDTTLWRDVELDGWQAVDNKLEVTHGGYLDREADWELATPTGMYGCGECQWRGPRRDLVELGVDGEPLPEISPGQEALEI